MNLKTGALLLLVGSMGLFGFCLSGCQKKQELQPKYGIGQMVKSVLSGQTGQVIRADCWNSCQYQIRFSSDTSEIPSHFLGSGGDMQKKSFSAVWMQEFELTT
jgi:hypothetical protein